MSLNIELTIDTQKNATTNSWTKSWNQIKQHFTEAEAIEVQKILGPYDQHSFEHRFISNGFLVHVKGVYKLDFFTHKKTLTVTRCAV